MPNLETLKISKIASNADIKRNRHATPCQLHLVVVILIADFALTD